MTPLCRSTFAAFVLTASLACAAPAPATQPIAERDANGAINFFTGKAGVRARTFSITPEGSLVDGIVQIRAFLADTDRSKC